MGFSKTGGAESGAVGAQHGPVDAELAQVVEVWPKLPRVVKAGIMTMVRATGDTA